MFLDVTCWIVKMWSNQRNKTELRLICTRIFSLSNNSNSTGNWEKGKLGNEGGVKALVSSVWWISNTEKQMCFCAKRRIKVRKLPINAIALHWSKWVLSLEIYALIRRDKICAHSCSLSLMGWETSGLLHSITEVKLHNYMGPYTWTHKVLGRNWKANTPYPGVSVN